MKTSLTTTIQQTSWSEEANQILRTCVHCGFCTAVCPTYQLFGNELDGPRGRIYLIKSFLEGNPVSAETQRHLDRCLTCRACETACPSGVQYGRLADLGRGLIEQQVPRRLLPRLIRWGLRTILPYPNRFNKLLTLGQSARPFLPNQLRPSIPMPIPTPSLWPTTQHKRTMLVLTGCVQSSLTPHTNLATAQVLDQLGIQLLPTPSGCCGALNYHLAAHSVALDQVRNNIDTWWPMLETGAEAIITTASGCGVFVKEYGYLLRHDPIYAHKAARVSKLTWDIGEILAKEDLSPLLPATATKSPTKVALHVPCTLQHGQKLVGLVESLLKRFGFELTHVPDAHLCCGSAGTYSILHRAIAQQLLTHKLTALQSGNPHLIVTANIGCQMHLQSQAQIPVKHWIELIAKISDKS